MILAAFRGIPVEGLRGAGMLRASVLYQGRRSASACTRSARLAAQERLEAKTVQDLPGPRGLPGIGTLLEHVRSSERMHELWEERCRTYGPIFRERTGPTEMVVICDPSGVEQLLRHSSKHPRRLKFAPIEAIRDESGLPYGLLLSNGERWARLRRPLNQTMMKPRTVDGYAGDLDDISKELVTRMEINSGPNGEVPDLEKEVLKWSLEGMYSVLYDKRLGCQGDGNKDSLLKLFVENVSEEIKLISELFFIPPWACRLLLPHKWRALQTNFTTGLRIAAGHVQEKVRELEEKEDSSDSLGVIEFLLRDGSFSPDEILVNISELMSAAVGTTTNTALVLLHELACHPQVQARLRAELDACLGPTGPVSPPQLKDMPYLNAVLKETMRFCPVAGGLSRITSEDVVIHGYRIPAETPCLVPMYAMSRDPSLFSEPDVFRPERWLRDGGDNIPPFAVLPFGFGSRMCIGRRVAELEMRLLMVNVLRRFVLETEETRPMRFRNKLILEPKEPVRIRLQRLQ